MLFSDLGRHDYARSPLIEVICQLRFPTILSINTREPAELQEAIRNEFPRFATREEKLPPKVVNQGTPQAKLEQQGSVNNYNFVSEDGTWKINLTKDFIAFSTLRYTTWEDFAAKMDKPLAEFIQIYKPAFYERIGLRYVNAISRKMMGLTDCLWDDLIEQPYLGVLGEPDVDETKVGKSSVDTQMTLSDGALLKIHAGPGLLNGGKKDPEHRFILDFDLSVKGNLGAETLATSMDSLHDHAVACFNGAITEELRTAMGPTPKG